MRAEIVGVGTELLLGQIANSNAQVISRALAAAGVDVYFHAVVGDNLARMSETIARAVERSDAVVVTGGLGPTPDDITREGIAAALGRDLRRDPGLEQTIRAIFERIGRDMPAANLRQADLPEGAVPIPPEGTAPGFYVDAGERIVFALPGVPWEMEAMLRDTVVPLLLKRTGAAALVSRNVLVVGLGESRTHELISDVVESQTNPTIAFLAGGGQVRVRISAKAGSEADANALIDPVEEEIRRRLGDAAVDGDHDSIADALGAVLRDRDLTVAAAESLTGGTLASALTRAEGASDFFLGAAVCYATESKRAVLGVDEDVLETHGAVSAETAAQMAEGAARLYGTDLGVATTGVAGPSPQEGKPVGLIFVAASMRGETETRRIRGYGDRSNNKALAVTAALDLGRRLAARA